ncbi:hypothetical protein AN958_11828 [Leucoagaricus sp. SymC.cos]|nr:hypothetical protein AN958_11828 [Leucoagaricus sp. SymC.cos]
MRKYVHTSIFSQLPNELLDEIARCSDLRELKALCLVSKRTGDVATRRLYNTIVLENYRNAIRCFKTLIQRQYAASCVRRLAIDVLAQNLFGNFYRLAAAALKRTTNLIGLDIANLGPLPSLLASTHFPRLMEVKIPYSPSITSFLKTNRQVLKAVVIDGPASANEMLDSSKHFTDIELPELMAFVGPCNVIPHVVPGSQVQYLTVCWEPGCERLKEIMKCVAQSRQEVLGMDNLVLGWNPGLLGVIAECVPRIERLRVRNLCPFTTQDMIEVSTIFPSATPRSLPADLLTPFLLLFSLL